MNRILSQKLRHGEFNRTIPMYKFITAWWYEYDDLEPEEKECWSVMRVL